MTVTTLAAAVVPYFKGVTQKLVVPRRVQARPREEPKSGRLPSGGVLMIIVFSFDVLVAVMFFFFFNKRIFFVCSFICPFDVTFCKFPFSISVSF